MSSTDQGHYLEYPFLFPLLQEVSKFVKNHRKLQSKINCHVCTVHGVFITRTYSFHDGLASAGGLLLAPWPRPLPPPPGSNHGGRCLSSNVDAAAVLTDNIVQAYTILHFNHGNEYCTIIRCVCVTQSYTAAADMLEAGQTKGDSLSTKNWVDLP